jgi:hypothetical protein
MIEEMLALTGKRQDNIIRRSYEQQIADAPNPEEVKRLNEAMTNDRKENRLANPAWDREYSSFSGGQRQSNARLAISRTKNMLGFLLEKNGKLNSDQQEIDNAINIYFYYESQKKGLIGTRAQQAVEKERLDAEMNAALIDVSEQSEIARNFVESVIEDTIFDSRYFNKQGVN